MSLLIASIYELVHLIKTASAEEAGNTEQADQGWLHLHVNDFISCWDCRSYRCHMATGQVFVIHHVLV